MNIAEWYTVQKSSSVTIAWFFLLYSILDYWSSAWCSFATVLQTFFLGIVMEWVAKIWPCIVQFFHILPILDKTFQPLYVFKKQKILKKGVNWILLYSRLLIFSVVCFRHSTSDIFYRASNRMSDEQSAMFCYIFVYTPHVLQNHSTFALFYSR